MYALSCFWFCDFKQREKQGKTNERPKRYDWMVILVHVAYRVTYSHPTNYDIFIVCIFFNSVFVVVSSSLSLMLLLLCVSEIHQKIWKVCGIWSSNNIVRAAIAVRIAKTSTHEIQQQQQQLKRKVDEESHRPIQLKIKQNTTTINTNTNTNSKQHQQQQQNLY